MISAAFLTAAVVPVSAADPLRLQKSVRTLEALQDGAANGDASALPLQSRLIAQIETDIRLADDRDLQRTQNLQAMAVALLSGADPTVIEAHVMSLKMEENQQNLLQGALAYARADREAASKYLNAVNTEELPASLAGRVALVRSIIDSGHNTVRAIDDLYTARQLMPGTSIEEAALRRCIAFAGRTSDVTRLQLCTSRYMRRFAQSVYWKEFEKSLALAVGQSGYGEELARFIAETEDLGMSRQRSLLLAMASAALTHGRLKLAVQLVDAAIPVCFAESPDMARAKLYRAAAMLVDGNFPEGQKLLAGVVEQRLGDKDRKLYAIARHIEKDIGTTPAMSANEAYQVLSVQANATADPEIDRVIAAAESAIKTSQQLFSAKQP